MKQQQSFRLGQKTLVALEQATAQTSKTKTEIVEIAVQRYTLSLQQRHNKFRQFAGIWPRLDVQKLMSEIKQGRKNKDFQLDL